MFSDRCSDTKMLQEKDEILEFVANLELEGIMLREHQREEDKY